MLLRWLTAAFRDLWRIWPEMLIFHVVFSLINFAATAPLMAWLIRRLAAASGNAAVGNYELAKLLITPAGLALSALIAVVFLVILLSELAGAAFIGYGAAEGLRITYMQALWFVVSRMANILRASVLALLAPAAVMLSTAAAIALVWWMLLTDHDINFYLEARPTEFHLAIAAGATLAAIGAATLTLCGARYLFVFPEKLFREGRTLDHFRRSRLLATGRLGSIAGAALVWLGLWGAASLAVNGLLYQLGALWVSIAGERMSLLLAVLAGMAALNAVGNAALSFLGIATGCLLLAHLHRDACHRLGLSAPTVAPAGAPPEARPRWTAPRLVPLAAALGAAAFSAVAAVQVIDGASFGDHVGVSAHRGASLVAPENTLSAVRRAIEDGATHVEIDVQQTADGVLVVVHDADLMRVARSPLVVRQATFADLRRADVGRSFAPEFAGERVPTLDEVIDVARGKAQLLIELKSFSGDPHPMVREVANTFAARQLYDEAAVMSLKYAETQMVKRSDPRIRTGFVATAAVGDISRLRVDFLAAHRVIATDRLIAAAHAQGRQVFVWSVDHPRHMTTMIDRGADNIITKDPAALTALLEARRELSNAERILLRFRSLYVD